MQRERLTSAIVATVFIPALGLGLTGAASARTISAAHYSERTVVINCQGRPQVQPGSLTLACADGNDYLADLNWTTWAPGLAGATGVQVENTASPTARPVTSTAIQWTRSSGAAPPPGRAASATPRSPCSTRGPGRTMAVTGGRPP